MAPKQMDEVEEMKDDIKRILFLMESNDKLGHEGLINKVNRIDRALSDLLVREQIYKTKAATYGAIAGGIISAVAFALKGFIAKIFVLS